MRVTLGGATEEEVENYRRCVKGEIIPPKKEFKTLGDNNLPERIIPADVCFVLIAFE